VVHIYFVPIPLLSAAILDDCHMADKVSRRSARIGAYHRVIWQIASLRMKSFRRQRLSPYFLGSSLAQFFGKVLLKEADALLQSLEPGVRRMSISGPRHERASQVPEDLTNKP
jgi:hypothetical protein